MLPGIRHLRTDEWLMAVGLSLFAGLALVYGVELGLSVPAGVAAAILIVLCVLVLMYSLGACRASLQAGGGFTHLGSVIFALGILFAVVLPGVQLLVGARSSRLEESGFPTQDAGSALGLAFLLFCLALVAFYAGEHLAHRPGRQEDVRARSRRPLGRTWEARTTYGFLIVVGVTFVIINTAVTGSAERGTVQGHGFIQLFGYAAPLGIAIGLLNRHWGSRVFVAVSVATFAYLLSSGIRTPLLIVAVAAGVRFLYSSADRRIGPRQVLVSALAIYVGAVMLVALSIWRGQKEDETGVTLPTIVENTAGDPWGRLQQQGLDTVDGLILSTKVDRDFVGVSTADPLKIVTGFVPRQIWPEKPPWLGEQVTQHYTNFGAGGIFLSGPGYAIIVFGTAAAVPVLFLLLGFFSESIFRRMTEPSIWTALLAYFFVRFFFAGDAFDAFHVLGLCLVVMAGRTFSGVVAVLHRRPEARRRVQPRAWRDEPAV